MDSVYEIKPTTSADGHQVSNEILAKMDELGVLVFFINEYNPLSLKYFFNLLTIFPNTFIIWNYFRSTLSESVIKLERTREALKKLSDCVGVTRVCDSSDSSDNESNLSDGSQIRIEQHDADFGATLSYTTNVSLYILLIRMDTTTVPMALLFFYFDCFTLNIQNCS